MRTEQEMLDLILETARSDERIRAVLLNGSRANPNAPRDFFQDFDIVYLVSDPRPFIRNLEWIGRFGARMILQLPDDMPEPPPTGPLTRYAYLMQFLDGNRLDLTIFPAASLSELESDSQTLLLLDKDGLFPALPPPGDADYLPHPPSAKAFEDCCNEFWWCAPYVAKGLWRRELPYAKAMLERHLREQLMEMLGWHVGLRHSFLRSPGKMGKYLEQLLEPELWELLLETWADADDEHTWQALFAMCDLFRRAALPLAEHFGFTYPLEDDARVEAHLHHVHDLPRDAAGMYP